MTVAALTPTTDQSLKAHRGQRPSEDWWFVRAYPGSSKSMDRAVQAVVPWVRARAEEMAAKRWFFMRYLDTNGHHVRLRIQSDPDSLDAVHTRLPELNRLIHQLSAPGEEPRLISGADLGELSGGRGIRAAPYSPELEKYGGAKGFEAALDLFYYASRWSAEHEVASLHQPTQRAALAFHYQQRLVQTALPSVEQQSAFWSAHRKQWGPQLRILLPRREDFSAHVATLRRSISKAELSQRQIEGIGDLVSVMTQVFQHATAAAPFIAPHRFLLELMHMDMNRWGLMPAEECLIGFLAAQDHEPKEQ